MSAIDWTNHGLHLLLAGAGAILIVLGVLLSFLSAARRKWLALVAGIVGGLAAGTALGLHLIPAVPPAAPANPSEPLVQTVSDPAPAPAEGKSSAPRLPADTATWYTVRRGDVILDVTERGIVESADNADVAVKVHAVKPGGDAASIRFLAADGATVKKGQLLVELDDSALQESLTNTKAAVDHSKADLTRMRKQAELDIERSQLDLEDARHQLALAERDRQAYKGDDAERKKGLELKVKHAQQLIKTRELQTTTTKARSGDVLRTNRAIVDAETAKLKDLETEIANCKMYAPRDGQVFYYVPPRVGFAAAEPSLAVGGPVREGQKLLYIPDLSKMQVNAHVHESQIGRVRQGQLARVRFDAFPDRTPRGQVSRIAHSPREMSLFVDEKVYPVTVRMTEQLAGLLPGMSAEVHIELERRDNVLRVPVQALLRREDKIVCFVKSAAEMEERPVKVGLRDLLFAEIIEGLQEGEQVLRDAHTAAKPRREEAAKADPAETSRIVVRSVKPAEDAGAKRPRVSVYGITKEDQERLAALPGVAHLAPLRILSSEAHHLARRHSARIVGATAAYRQVYPLELEAGRFLSDDDESKIRNVVVLGSGAAQTLFPGEDVLGQNVLLGRYFYVVVGVLKARQPLGERMKAEEFNDDIYLPLSTLRARFGEVVTFRQAGAFVREQVYLHQVLLRTAKREQARETADAARKLLESAHPKKDWDMEIVSAP
jgi:RND family efflux transporter MFP subunit